MLWSLLEETSGVFLADAGRKQTLVTEDIFLLIPPYTMMSCWTISSNVLPCHVLIPCMLVMLCRECLIVMSGLLLLKWGSYNTGGKAGHLVIGRLCV